MLLVYGFQGNQSGDLGFFAVWGLNWMLLDRLTIDMMGSGRLVVFTIVKSLRYMPMTLSIL